jgi:hypothetical protein
MSHNKIKVANQAPDASGNISLSSLTIDDLSNVTITSPSLDQVIKYDGSNYVNASAPAGEMEYILIGQGESQAYNTSPATSMSNGQTIYVYDTNPINTIVGATLSSTNDWHETITLPTGKYHVLIQTRVGFSASGYLVAGMMYSSGKRSSQLVIGDNSSSYAVGVSTTINSYLEATSGQAMNFEIIASSNIDSVANQANIISEFTSILIVKLST